MADGIFGNIYDVKRQQRQDLEESAMDFAQLPRGRGQVAAAGMAGGQLARGIGGMLGMQTPEEARVAKLQEIMSKYADADKTNLDTYKNISGDLLQNNFYEEAKEAMNIYETMFNQASTSDLSNLGKYQIDAEKILGCSAIEQNLGPNSKEFQECKVKATELAMKFKGQQSGYQEQSGKVLADQEPKIAENASRAKAQLAKLKQLEGFLESNIYTGMFAESLVEPALGFAAALGFDGAGIKAGNMQAFRANAMEMALGYVNQTKGAVSDREFEAFLQASAGLNRTKFGNQLIIQTAKALAKKESELQRVFVEWKRDAGTDATFGDWLDHKEQWESNYDLNLPYTVEDVQKALNAPIFGQEEKDTERSWTDRQMLEKCSLNPSAPECKDFLNKIKP